MRIITHLDAPSYCYSRQYPWRQTGARPMPKAMEQWCSAGNGARCRAGASWLETAGAVVGSSSREGGSTE